MINYKPLFLLFILSNFEKSGGLTTVLLIILFCSILIADFYFSSLSLKKQNSHKQFFEKSVTKNNNKESVELNPTIRISSEVVIDILKKLDTFEKNKDYLNKDLCLPKLASTLNTNTSYLSKVINCHKEKSFTTYINQLRIDYICEQLRNDPIYTKYTIKALSEIAGFNSTQQFSDAFYERTEFRPSYFINETAKKEA